jgi:hypothetical protein
MIDGQILTADGPVSEAHERIARIIKEYDPTLDLAWIPPQQRNPLDPSEKAWAVLCTPVGAPQYIVLTSDTCDERLLARVFRADSSRQNILDSLDAHNAAIEAVRLRKELDEEEERKEFIATMARSGLHTYRHNGKVYSK